ncbi:la-related protein 6A isoform X2 [Diospyros lotus]|uniref:la-related protein 6A isoform X2 n=1 Tax=Diospyros lotus TaxID=55363 RepID=UPI002254887C|nr:la-related protein 6A isoform X2 [Diospyros lotus]
MEDAAACPSAAPPSPPRDSGLLPVGSPEIADFHLEEEEAEEVPPSPEEHQPSQNPTLADDLPHKIIKQVEYYFSDENPMVEQFILKYATKDEGGFVPIAAIASFKTMRKITRDRSLIVAALKESSLLVVSPDGKSVRRLQPLPVSDAKDQVLCTVLVENLPEDHSIENMQRIFGAAGNIKNVCIRDPNVARESEKQTITEKLLNVNLKDVCIHDPNAPRKSRPQMIAEKLLTVRLHAFVEYETVDAAEKAVAMLNNEQDWRHGMRVKLLKRVGKKKKALRDAESEKDSHAQALDSAGDEANHYPSELHDDKHDEEYRMGKGTIHRRTKMATRVETEGVEGNITLGALMDRAMEQFLLVMVSRPQGHHQAPECLMEREDLRWGEVGL